MKLDAKVVLISLAVLVGVGWIAYTLGLKNAQPPVQTAAAPAAQQPTTNAAKDPHSGTAAAPAPAQRVSSSGIKFTHFRVGNRNVKDILADGNIIWVGTSGGVIRYDTINDKFRMYNVKSGLLSNGVFHLSKLEGRLLVGTYGGGMSLFDEKNETWETFNIPHGLGDAFVYDALKVANGDVWVATWSGVNRVRGGALRDRSKWDLYTVENTGGGLPNDWVYGLAEGKNGEIWLATEGGLARIKDGKWTNWKHKDGLGAPYEKVRKDIAFKDDPGKMSSHHARQKVEMGLQDINVAYNPNYIVALLVDADGVVWCGTWGGGLARFDGKQWSSYTVSDGLPGNHVFMLYQDKRKRLWVGTNNGLARKEGDSFKVLSTEDGLFSKYVFSMTSADDGSLWVGSFGGVARLRNL